MSTFVSPRRAGILPSYLLEHVAQAAPAHARQCALLSRQITAQLRQQRALGLLPRADAPTADAKAQQSAQAVQRRIYDAQQGTTLPGTLARDEGAPATQDVAVTEAYDYLGATHDFFQTVYGRNSIDAAGMPLIGTVHYERGYDNAFWNGEQMVFGDGDGEVFNRFTIAIDVVGHELTHGVTERTANLIYQGQSGALNESISDVFGVLIKQYTLGQSADQADWIIGAGLLMPGIQGVGLRSMQAPGSAYDDPALGKDPQPATMAGYVDTQEDDGGVHYNSGIPNHAFYRAALAIGGAAWEKTGRIWYRALTGGELAAGADFVTFADLTASVASAGYGANSTEAVAVQQAWRDVGVLA
ncbi:M4 family metallopeptidase [Xanthomonas campestris pv. merremiae]|uniref:M4 family metallopeptidase n=1 Tax=Xanthomonas citri TaxID=346 RepID=UPI000B5C438F|nr:M4 family metallopeptidase [Xanthomonas citri]ASK94970.1 peptidase M4 family protein [Xanthomonas citri pv. vignicola]MBV6839400.1 M4 family metallopeptidase [Xanthomonas campestris pv. merremiae]MBZ3934139.1 peptidase M4 [Xanthomonas campestris pv. merremiae]MCC8567178.1 M4 family metallopeptidase [Xanthomonas citri pv. fuscans]